MNEEQRRLLQRVLAGDLSAREAEDAGLLRDPEVARALAEMRTVQERLGRAGALKRAQWDAPGDPSLAAAEQRVRDLVAARGGRRARPSAGKLGWLAAAVVLIALPLLLLRGGGDGSDGPAPGLRRGVPLSGRVELVAPLGTVESIARFEWRYALPRGASFQLVLREDRGGAVGAELARIRDLQATTWTPDIELPARFHWSVEVFDDSGNFLSSSQAELVELAGAR